MPSLNSIYDRAFRIANAQGIDANVSPTVDSLFLTEDLLISALRAAVIQDNFTRVFDLECENGRATLPDAVLLDKMPAATIFNADSPDEPTSYETRSYDYRAAPHDQLNYAHAVGNLLLFREAGGQPDEFDGTVTLYVAALPDLPTDPDASVEMPETLADSVALNLANMMRGSK